MLPVPVCPGPRRKSRAMGHQAAVAAEGEPRALPRRLGQVGRSRVSPQWSPKALTKLRAWGWHLVHEEGTGPGAPQQKARARGLGSLLPPQGPEGKTLHTDCTVAGSGTRLIRAKFRPQSGYQQGQPPVFMLRDGWFKGCGLPAGAGRERQDAEEPGGSCI